jgi:hypothetical protein
VAILANQNNPSFITELRVRCILELANQISDYGTKYAHVYPLPDGQQYIEGEDELRKYILETRHATVTVNHRSTGHRFTGHR